ncbi:MAG: hypothetical protein JWL63_3262 [Rhodocyclales bacterium]|nr:hypothetical protein [Rhodocyclales bacterium]
MPRLAALSRITIIASTVIAASCATTPPTGPMSFFITSVNPGKGADLGGLAGADAHCQKLATAVGAGSRTWHAYLSTSSTKDTPAVNARDRIGKGPWFNAKGELIATDVEQLHGVNNITKLTALSESGKVINGAGDTPNTHDILTGSRMDGTALAPTPTNLTCENWTSSGEGIAMLGHSDRKGLTNEPWSLSWNSTHQSRGCSADALKSTGGAGLLYCFAAN